MTFRDGLAATRDRVLPTIRAVAGAVTGRMLLLVGLLAVCIAAAVWGPGWWAALNERFMTRYNGQIIVNSPGVYTRQRLVNDRLAQSTWLQDQLRVTTREFEKEFRSIDEVRAMRADSASGARFGIGRSGGAPNEGGGVTRSSTLLDDAKGDASATPTVSPTSADLFRAKNTYRDEVRTEIMETQLDDRHDIQGNTIYRLSFDATVVPGTRSDALAVIKVKLLHDHSQAENDTDTKKALDEQYFQLYEDWLRFMQKLVHRSVGAIAQSLYERKPDDRIAHGMPAFLLKRVCELMHNAKGSPDCDPTSGVDSDQLRATSNRISGFTTAYLAARSAKFQNQLRLNIIATVNKENDKLKRKRERLKKRQESKKGEAKQDENRQEDEPSLQQIKDSKLFLYALEESYQLCEQSQKRNFYKTASDTGDTINIPCSPINAPIEGLIGAAMLYDTLVKGRPATAGAAEEISTKLLAEVKTRCAGNQSATCNLPDTTKEALRCLAADYMWSQLNLHDRTTENPSSASPFGRSSTSTVHPVARYLRVQLVGRETGMCNLIFLGGSRTRDNKDEDPVTKLRRDLNEDVEVYAYSVTPKNLAQRLSTATDTRDAIQALLNANFSVGGRDASSVIETLQKKSIQSQAIQALPIVVGYGLAPAGAQPVTNGLLPAPPHTEFGWVISPQIKIGKQDERAHADRQYSLAAVISVPSWWRSMNLSIETCWVERGDLHKQTEFRQCVDKGTASESKTVHTVRLPGAISELSRKLGYEVVQEPRLEYRYPEDAPLRLEMGRPAQVLLIGGRIWRSTEVTLGSQKADEITVLPNMEGILAKFRCVRRQFSERQDDDASSAPPEESNDDLEESKDPHSSPPSKDATVALRVWTSEGVTDPPEYAMLVEPPMDKGKRAEMCPEERQEMQVNAPLVRQPPVAGQKDAEQR